MRTSSSWIKGKFGTVKKYANQKKQKKNGTENEMTYIGPKVLLPRA